MFGTSLAKDEKASAAESGVPSYGMSVSFTSSSISGPNCRVRVFNYEVTRIKQKTNVRP